MNSVVPRAKAHIVEKCCNQYTPQGADANKWVAISKDGKKLRADLVGKTCDCYEWQISGLPCVHTLCVKMEMRMDLVGFCSEYHMVAAYRRSYKGGVLPISDPSLWEKPNCDMLPPPLEKRTGRPRKVRRRSADENITQQQQQQKMGSVGFLAITRRRARGYQLDHDLEIQNQLLELIEEEVDLEGPDQETVLQLELELALELELELV
ncbi:hypothetical protein GIB67_005109 [Kingdonia uniflora]|uniref:SWIM-type domain-containing protein n=1 Tax=Kingdonia uniflora TaxID=39325 RepID=A0A7J7PCE0_9MAGN|nr:hypothetical protein GIB67_005109 [Kingdonia uniflora]